MEMDETEQFLSASGLRLSGRADFARKIVNTFFTFPFLFEFVVKGRHFAALRENRNRRDLPYLLSRLLQKTLWFWPRIIDARTWAEGGLGKERTPERFVTYDLSSQELCDAVERYASAKDARILDVGCNAGRHLNRLHERGFTNLSGVDVMRAALEHMRVEFPAAAKVVHLHHDLFQHFLLGQPDRHFDVVYSHGATIELVHPSFDVVRHLCRIARDHVVLILDESHRMIYPRFWSYEFSRNGFFLREARRPVGGIPPKQFYASLLVYRRFERPT
jgi:SAM-dependent methyltransferase